MRGLSLHHLIEGRAEFLALGSIRGSLVDLGGYPGAVADEAGSIRGEIYRLESAEVLAGIDSAEGLEFPRRLTSVRLHDGRELRAWTYWFNGSPDQGVPIPDGDYRRHVTVHSSSRSRTLFP